MAKPTAFKDFKYPACLTPGHWKKLESRSDSLLPDAKNTPNIRKALKDAHNWFGAVSEYELDPSHSVHKNWYATTQDEFASVAKNAFTHYKKACGGLYKRLEEVEKQAREIAKELKKYVDNGGDKKLIKDDFLALVAMDKASKALRDQVLGLNPKFTIAAAEKKLKAEHGKKRKQIQGSARAFLDGVKRYKKDQTKASWIKFIESVGVSFTNEIMAQPIYANEFGTAWNKLHPTFEYPYRKELDANSKKNLLAIITKAEVLAKKIGAFNAWK